MNNVNGDELLVSTGAWTGPIVDNHFHLDPAGFGIEAAKEFERAGGTGLVLVHKPDFSTPPHGKQAHKERYDVTLKLAQKVRDGTNLSVWVILGPHPAALARDAERIGIERAKEEHRLAIEVASRFVEEGVASGIGEVGRPHWPTPEETVAACDEILLDTMLIAKDLSCPLHLHVEGGRLETNNELAIIAGNAGLKTSLLVRHFSPPDISKKAMAGLIPSVLAGKGSVEGIVETLPQSEHGFVLETDYLDDPNRPGAVLGPKTIPKRTQQLASLLDEEVLWRCHEELPTTLYGGH